MVNPTTANVVLEVPVHGAEVDTWDQPMNRDFSAIDGMFGGTVTIGVTTGAVSLAIPAGAVPAAAPGPVQSQNRILRFTGALVGNVTVTLPLATKYVIDNQTTGNFNLQFRAATLGQLVAVQQGDKISVYNDGTNCFFADLGKVGDMEFWAGLSSMPSWVGFCSVPPYLLANGQINNISAFPALGLKMGSAFGGNGISTFGVPDMRGRVPLCFDSTNSRITFGQTGISGNVLGSANDTQSLALTSSQVPATAVTVFISDPSHRHFTGFATQGYSVGLGGVQLLSPSSGSAISIPTDFVGTGISASGAVQGGGQTHTNVQPGQVAGIWVVKT
jgi:microcystin-dependent protein